MGAESGLRRRVKGLSEAEFRPGLGPRRSAGRRCSSSAGARAGPARAAGTAGYAELKGRAVYQCNRCKRQVGLTAGTVFHWTIDRSAVDPVPQGREPGAREGCR